MSVRDKGKRTVTGTVVSDKMDRTIVVRIDRRVRYPLYGKIVTRSSKLQAHDEHNEAAIGDRVTLVESRPISKRKSWCLAQIEERASGGKPRSQAGKSSP